MHALHTILLPAAAPTTVHLLPAGEFGGRDGRGPYVLADPAAVIAATERHRQGADLVIDYDHQSDFAAVPGTGGRAPAAGWITALEARAGGLWATVDWTASGRAAIEAREYRYLSPVYTHDTSGRVTRILRAALTNTPNLALTALNREEPDMADAPAAAAAPPAQPPAASQATQTAAAAATPQPPPAGGQDARAPGPAGGQDARAPSDVTVLASVRQVLGLPETADGAAITAAIERRGGEAHVVVALAQRLEVAEQQLAALHSDRAAATVDALIAQGRVLPAERDAMIALHRQDPATAEALTRHRPVLVQPGATVPGAPPPAGGAPALQGDELAIARQLGIEPGDMAKILAAEAKGGGAS